MKRLQLYSGNEIWKNSSYCKNIEWQVMNKKMNSNSMEKRNKNNTLVLIQEWRVTRRKFFLKSYDLCSHDRVLS